MNLLEKRKKQLIALSVIVLVLSFLAFAGAVVLIIFGAINLAKASYVAGAIELVFGVILFFLSNAGLIFGITFTWTGSSLKALHGSIQEDNLAIGTVNMKKCRNCGTELEGDEKVCPNCGKSVLETVVCPECKTENSAKNKKCKNCGTDLK